MRELRTAAIVANEVSMLRASMGGPIVLVEGDTDTRLYRKFMLPAPYVRLTHCDGKPVLVETMELLRKRGIRQVLGICDADFDRIIEQGAVANVFHADLHDAEMMIVHTSSFRHVCDELYDTVLSDRVFQARRDGLLEIAARIGTIRMWNNIDHLQLSFRAVDPAEFLREGREFSYAEYVSQLLEVSTGTTVSIDRVLERMQENRGGARDGELACGHDFAALLDRDAAVKVQRDQYGGDVVEKMLRLSFDVHSFGSTDLVMELRRWEQRENVEVLTEELAN